MNSLFNTKYEDILPTLKSSSIDMVCADPPFGVTNCHWDSEINLSFLWNELNRIIKPNGAILLNCQQPFTSKLVMSNLKMFKQHIVWCKNKATGHLNAKKRLMSSHEDILLFSDKQVTYNPQKTKGHLPSHYAKQGKQSNCYNKTISTKYIGGATERYPTTLLNIAVHNNDGSMGKKINSTQKPVELTDWLIQTYTNRGMVVLDFVMGSGTTGVSCKKYDRKFIGIEMCKSQFSFATNRISTTLRNI